MKKNKYSSPSVSVEEVKIENGFAATSFGSDTESNTENYALGGQGEWDM